MWQSADRTSSIRASGEAMPSATVPDLESEASNTIMASSLQGVFGSAASAMPAAETSAMPKEIVATRRVDIHKTTPARHTPCHVSAWSERLKGLGTVRCGH